MLRDAGRRINHNVRERAALPSQRVGEGAGDGAEEHGRAEACVLFFSCFCLSTSFSVSRGLSVFSQQRPGARSAASPRRGHDGHAPPRTAARAGRAARDGARHKALAVARGLAPDVDALTRPHATQLPPVRHRRDPQQVRAAASKYD